eukprot:g6002.t1
MDEVISPATGADDGDSAPLQLNPKYHQPTPGKKPKQLTFKLTRSTALGYGLVLDHDEEASPRIWVDEVLSGSPAALVKMQPGDQLLRVARRDVKSSAPEAIVDLLASADQVQIVVRRPPAEAIQATGGDRRDGKSGGKNDGSSRRGGADARGGGGGGSGGGSGRTSEALRQEHEARESAEKGLHDARAAVRKRAEELIEQRAARRRAFLASARKRETERVQALSGGAALPPAWAPALAEWRATADRTELRLSLFPNGMVEVMQAEFPRRTVTRARAARWELDSWGVATAECEPSSRLGLRKAVGRGQGAFRLELQPLRRRGGTGGVHSPAGGGVDELVVNGICFRRLGPPRAFHRSHQCRRGAFSVHFGQE